MSEKYKTFFGLIKEPFGSDIATEDILVTPQIKAVAERFKYAIGLGATALVTGEIGSGKSTALRWVTGELRPSDYKLVRITACSGSIIEFYRQLVAGLEIGVTSNSKALLTREIKQRVFELVREKRQQPVIIVDEASLLKLEVFVELHTITQFDFDSKPWLPIVLIGQNNLVDKLKFRKSGPIASRVVARSHLNAVGKEEMKQYLAHHLEIAGTKTDPFSEAAHTAIFQGSGGLFRKANHLARGALIAAAKNKSSVVSPDHVKIASSEIF
jgi:type II secretory pathway predicted ATPase ExeA